MGVLLPYACIIFLILQKEKPPLVILFHWKY